MGTPTNNLYLSGVSSSLVYRLFGFEFNTVGSDITSKDGKYLFHPGNYVELELYVSDWPGWLVDNQRLAAIPMKDDQGNKVKVTESQFLVITKDEYYNSRWAKWTDSLNFGRMEELLSVDVGIPSYASDPDTNEPLFDENGEQIINSYQGVGDGQLIIHDIKYINENELTGTTFPNRILRQRVDVDYDVFLNFDSYNECLSRFTDILEYMKTYFNNSFDDYSYEYDLNIITNEEDALYRPGTLFTTHSDVVNEYIDTGLLLIAPGIISRNYYTDLGGLYKATGCHYQVIYTKYDQGQYTGYGNEHNPYSVMNLYFWNDQIPKLENDYWWAQVQLHELGHCLGLDHSFTNLQTGWKDLFPSLEVDGLDNLTRFLELENTEHVFNNGQFFQAYSGESPGKAAIMSYQLDPAPLYRAPFNSPALMDNTNTVYSAVTTYRDYPLTTDPIGCLFVNRGPINTTFESGYTNLNLHLYSYMSDGEFSEGEVTGMTLNFTATTGIEKYMIISYWDSFIDTEDLSWTDTMTYAIVAQRNGGTPGATSIVYTKLTPEVPPENLISGNTRQESIELDVSNLVSLGVLDYDDLLNFEVLVTYSPPGTSGFQGNVLLEINDLNLQIQTTGGTFVRKAKEFYTIFSGTSKTSHPGVIFPFNDRFTSYEVEGCKPELYVKNHLYSLNESSDDIVYIIEIDLEENTFDPPTYINAINLSTFNKTKTLLSETVFGKFSLLYIKDFKVDENYLYVVRQADSVVISGETYNLVHLVERYAITNHVNFSFVETPEVSTLYTFYDNTNYTVVSKIDLADDGDVYLTLGESTSFKITLESSQETILKSITLDDNYITGNSSDDNAFGYLDAKSGSTNSTFFLATDIPENYYRIGVLNQELDVTVTYHYIAPSLIYGGSQEVEFPGRPNTIFFNESDTNYDLSIVLDTGKILNLTGNTSDNGKEISPDGLQLIYDFYSGSTSELQQPPTLSAVYKNYKDVEYSFYSTKTLFLSGLGTNFTYLFNTLEPIGINPSIGDKISGLTYNIGFEYNNNTLINGETFYQVADFNDWFLGYNLYRTHTLPLVDDNGQLIDYEFDIVDPSDTQPTVNFTGTVRIKLFLYLNSFYGDGTGLDSTSINSSINSALNYFSSHIEENAEIGNYGFNFDVSWEIFDFDVIPPYDVGSNNSFRNYFQNTLEGSPKNYSGGSPHIIFSVCPEITLPDGLEVENIIYGQAFEESVYSTMVVSDPTDSSNWDRILFGHLLGCNLGLKPTTEQGWSAVFNDLLIDALDTAGGTSYTPNELVSSGDTTGNQIKYMAYYGELSGLDSKKLSIMSQGSFNTTFYDCPPNAQAALDENKIDSDETSVRFSYQDLPNVGDNFNVSYIGFLDDVEIGNPQLDYIEVKYRDSWDQLALRTTIDLINSGNTNTYNILSGATGNTFGNKTLTISGDNLFNVFDYNDQYGFGVKISRERISTSGFATTLNYSRGNLEIKFYLSDGTVLEKLPTDLFNTTSSGEIVQSYAETANRTEFYNSYELSIIKRTLNYYLYNYYKD